MPPRVVHVISNLGTGGAENMLLRLLEREAEASRAGEHAVISLLSDGALVPQVRALGVELHELGASRSLKTALLLPRLRTRLAETRPAVIQGWMYHANIAASAARLFLSAKPPIVWNIRQTVQNLSNNSLLTQAVIMAGTVFRKTASGIVYNSEVSARQHEKLGYPQSKRIIIENGFDVADHPDKQGGRDLLMRDLGLGPDALLIGRVARKAAQKDDPTLFSTFGKIAHQCPDAHLVLVGYGMERDDPELIALADQSGYPGRVHFLGERLDVDRLTPGFDVAISSSAHSEGFSNVIAEAMAAGVPTLATDVGDAAKILDDPARVMAPRDADALATAVLDVLRLSSEERAQLGDRDRQRIKDKFEMAAISARYRELWDNLCSSP